MSLVNYQSQRLTNMTFPIVACPILTNSFGTAVESTYVYVGTDPVVNDVDEDPVAIERDVFVESETDLLHLVVTDFDSNTNEVSYTIAKYKNEDHYDFTILLGDAGGIDAESYLITGWLSGGDNQRLKQAHFLTMHFYKTEDGFIEVDGDFVPTNQSSCKIQSQWAWANHTNSGKWGTEFQAYRHKRMYFPVDVNDNFDNGFYTVISRNKLRGSGKVLSLLIKSEPGKHLDLIGWSMMLGVAPGV